MVSSTFCMVCAVSLLGLPAVSCSTSRADEERQHAELVSNSYRSLLEHTKPAWVFVTIPENAEKLPRKKRVEFDTLRLLLEQLSIPYETARYADMLTEFHGEIDDKDHQTFALSAAIAARCRGGTIYYIHLGGSKRLRTFIHPLARKNGINVQFVYDPLDQLDRG